MNDSNINLHIERLVLDGIPLPHSQRPLVQAAVEAELARLLASGGLSAELRGGGTLRQVPGGSIQLMQYPPTDRRNEESLTSPPTSPDIGNSNRTTPNRSSALALGQQIAHAVYSGIGNKQSGGKPQ